MGYYSEVAIAIKKEDWERLKKEAAKSEVFKDIEGGMTKLWEQITLLEMSTWCYMLHVSSGMTTYVLM